MSCESSEFAFPVKEFIAPFFFDPLGVSWTLWPSGRRRRALAKPFFGVSAAKYKL